ncbi:MAG: hypothetical protein AAGD96_24905, partial [Chloroflexota bacterium]
EISYTNSMNRLLAERGEVLSDKVVTVFELGYPINLDATATSQITAYYGLYSTGSVFVDTAARILFGDFAPRGASPISIGAVGYDLDEVISPNPAQIIGLRLIKLGDDTDEELSGLFPGDPVRLQTGIISDLNGNPVPDGTIVEFTQEDRVQGGYSVIAEVRTIEGQASFDFVLSDRVGQFRLRASAGQAIASDEVDIAILENETAQVEVITPTPRPTETPTPTLIPTATPTAIPPTQTPTPTVTPIPTVEPTEPEIRITLSELQTLGSMLIGLFGVGWLGNLTRSRSNPFSGRLRKILWGLLFSLVGYIWFLTEMPGSELLPTWGVWRWAAITIVCGLPGIGLAWLFNQVFEVEDE